MLILNAMKKLILYALVSFGFSLFFSKAFSQPKIQFQGDSTFYRVGTMPYNSNRLLATIKFKNIGDAPLLITWHKTTCGCDYSKCSKNHIAPSDSSFIEYYYDIKRLGPINKSLYVYTNDPNNELVVIRFKGAVIKPEISEVEP